MVSILDRLLLREVFKALAVILCILLLALLATHMVKLLGKAAEGSINPNVLLHLVGLQVIKVSGVLLPPAFFFALLWVLGGMYRDSEMVALQAGGVGGARILRSVLLLTLPVALIAGLLTFYLAPWAQRSIDNISYEQRNSADISGVRAGRFNEFRKGDLVVYAAGIDQQSGVLQKVFVQDRQHQQAGVVLAREALQRLDANTGERFIVLRDGVRYEGQPGHNDYVVARFQEYAVRLPSLDLGGFSLRTDAQPTAVLLALHDIRALTELQARLAVPLLVLVFAVLAIPLARSQPRREVFGRILLAVFLYFAAINLQKLAETWMSAGKTPIWMGMWWVPASMLLIALLLTLWDSPRWAAMRRSRGSEGAAQ